MKNKEVHNYLDYIYTKNPDINWTLEGDEVILHQKNTGLFNRIFQIILKKPEVSYIHLEELGSFIWPLIDGQTSIYDIGKEVHSQFGEAAEPLYERLSVYFKQLESYNFIIKKY